jgi:hypothetical protein
MQLSMRVDQGFRTLQIFHFIVSIVTITFGIDGPAT